MIALLKKDWQVFRGPLYGGAVILAVPYLIAAIATSFFQSDWRTEPIRGRFFAAGMVDIWLIALLAATFGGFGLRLRTPRTQRRFPRHSPHPTHQIILSKLLLAISSLIAMWLINLTVVAVIVYSSDGPYTFATIRHDMFEATILLATAQIMLFGLAWLLSTFLSSPVLAVSISAGFTIASIILIYEIFNATAVPPSPDVERRANWFIFYWTLSFGIGALIAGTRYYLRRVEP